MATIALVMHEPLASAFSECARHILGSDISLKVFDIPADADIDLLTGHIVNSLKNQQDGALIVCDLVGATPYNIAKYAIDILAKHGTKTAILTGANLNMVIKALVDPIKDPYKLRESVCDGAVRGIVTACITDENIN